MELKFFKERSQEAESLKAANAELKRELLTVKGELISKEAEREHVESLQKAIDVFRDETAKAKSESHLLKLELEKSKRVHDETRQDLASLQEEHQQLLMKVEKQRQLLKESKA